jgi:hypothetical protein
LGVAGVGTAPASTPAPPGNDNYLFSLPLNAPGKSLNSTATLKDVEDTTNASVQTNIFSPCGQSVCPQGPAEPTTCHGVSYGKTIWYDFYPQADGSVSIRTAGYDNVIALHTFNGNPRSPSYLLPNPATCLHQSSFPSEQLVSPVKKGLSYTFQIGAAGGADLERV